MKLIDGIKAKYEKRIGVILNALRQSLIEAGIPCCEVFDMHDESYAWCFVAEPAGKEAVDIRLEIAESEHYGDGDTGVSFSVNICSEGGRPLGGLTPYNYTEQCWVPKNDPHEVEERFCIIEQAEIDDIVTCVMSSPLTNEAARDATELA